MRSVWCPEIDLVTIDSTFANRVRSLNVRRMPLGVKVFFQADELRHRCERLLEEGHRSKAPVLGGEEQLGRLLLGRRELRGDVPPQHVHDLRRDCDALAQLGLRRVHELVADRVRTANEDDALVPEDIGGRPGAAEGSQGRRSKARREAEKGHRVLRRELVLHPREEGGGLLARERVRLLLRVGLMLGGVERGNAFGGVEGKTKLPLRSLQDMPKDGKPAVGAGCTPSRTRLDPRTRQGPRSVGTACLRCNARPASTLLSTAQRKGHCALSHGHRIPLAAARLAPVEHTPKNHRFRIRRARTRARSDGSS